jgi:LEA14-like dessication related protein
MRIIVVILILSILGSCSNVKAPEFKSIKDLVADANGKVITVKGMGLFYNPNTTKMVLKSANIEVFMNEQSITRINRKFDLLLLPEHEFVVPLEVDLNQDQIRELIKNNALQLLLGKGLKFTYKGNIRVRAYHVTIKVPLYQDISVNVNDLL